MVAYWPYKNSRANVDTGTIDVVSQRFLAKLNYLFVMPVARTKPVALVHNSGTHKAVAFSGFFCTVHKCGSDTIRMNSVLLRRMSNAAGSVASLPADRLDWVCDASNDAVAK